MHNLDFSTLHPLLTGLKHLTHLAIPAGNGINEILKGCKRLEELKLPGLPSYKLSRSVGAFPTSRLRCLHAASRAALLVCGGCCPMLLGCDAWQFSKLLWCGMLSYVARL